MIGLYHYALASVLRRRGNGDVATRIASPFLLHAERLSALADGMTALHDERTTALFLMLIHDAVDNDVWGAAEAAMRGVPATTVLSDLMADEDVSVRYLAAQALAMRDVPVGTLHALVASGEPRAAAASWGLAVRGDTTAAVLHLTTHARELVPRLVVLGARGLRALCLADPRCFPERAFDEAASLIADRQRHRRVLDELAIGGSTLAMLALERMPAETIEERIAAAIDGETEPGRVWTSLDESGRGWTNLDANDADSRTYGLARTLK